MLLGGATGALVLADACGGRSADNAKTPLAILSLDGVRSGHDRRGRG